MSDNRQTLSTREAADELGVGKSTIVRMIHRGDLDAHRKTPAKQSPFRIPRSSIEEVKHQRRRR